MSKEDYREKIEEDRQTIKVEKPNSRQSRSRVAKNKKPRRRDPLLTTLAVIFIFIPIVVLVYVWGFYSPNIPGKAQGNDNEETLEYVKNDNLDEDESNIDEPVLIDDTVDKEEDDSSVGEVRNSNKDDRTNVEQKTNKDTTTKNDKVSAEETNHKTNGQEQEKQVANGKHKVESGETLYRISLKYNTTVDAIMEANRLQTPDIQVGQSLIIP